MAVGGVAKTDSADDQSLEEDLLCGLYPEDFSFILNSSAFLPPPQEEEKKVEDACLPLEVEGGVLHPSCGVDPSCRELAEEPLNCIPESPPPPPSPPQPIPSSGPSPSHRPHPPAITTPPPIVALSSRQVDYPINTFYGLPLTVKTCLEEHRGITDLYGN